MIQGGDDLYNQRPLGSDDWMVAYDPYGSGATVGNHREHLEALNVANAVPGRHYYYARADANDILRLQNRGWQVVQGEDPERFGSGRLPEGVQSWTGGPRAFQDVVLMWMDQTEYDRQQAERQAQYKDRLTGAIKSRDALDSGERLGSQMHGNATGAPVIWAKAGHGLRIDDK